MANLGNQTIVITMFGDPATGSPTHVQSYLYIPPHVHQLVDLAGRYEDVLPQYMTEDRAANLFIDLSRQLLDNTTVTNIGGGSGLYYNKIDDTLRFKSLVAGSGVTLSVTNETITINTSGGSATTITFVPSTPADWDTQPTVVSQALDLLAVRVRFNDAKVTNATHTGDVTGSGALTIDPTAITGKPAATVASGDLVLVADINDANALKQVTAQSIANLVPGGGKFASVRTTSLDDLAAGDDDGFVMIDTAGSYAVPAVTLGFEITIKNVSVGIVTLTSISNIDGIGSLILNSMDTTKLYSSATTYWIVT